MEITTWTWLVLGFGLGLVHAFDADHVMALSVFSAKGRSTADGVRAGLRWALGHGLVLVGVGGVLLLLGQAIPNALLGVAEHGVGFVMIALGVWVWIELVRQRGHLHFHDHDDLPPHAHWHSHTAEARAFRDGTVMQSDAHAEAHRHQHGAFLVGGLHGLAGSAPILAVLPAAAKSPALGLGYLLVFTLGVGVAMAIVSGALGHVAGRFHGHGDRRRLVSLRAVSASGSIAIGIWMLVPAASTLL